MAPAVYAETVENLQHSTRLSPKSEITHLNSSRENRKDNSDQSVSKFPYKTGWVCQGAATLYYG
jgi:hypothetical protein